MTPSDDDDLLEGLSDKQAKAAKDEAAYKQQMRAWASEKWRDKFAMAAIIGLLAYGRHGQSAKDAAEGAYLFADAMLKAREAT